MKGIDWLANILLAVILVALLFRGGASTGSGGDAALDDARARVARIEEALRGASADSIRKKLDTLTEAVAWLEESVATLDASPPSETLGTGTGSRGSDGVETEEDTIARQAVARAEPTAARIALRLDLPPEYESEVLRIWAEHELRVLTGRVRDLEDFPVMFNEFKAFLAGDRLKILLTEFGPRLSADEGR